MDEEAYRELKESAVSGNPHAMVDLADYYFAAPEDETSKIKALAWYWVSINYVRTYLTRVQLNKNPQTEHIDYLNHLAGRVTAMIAGAPSQCPPYPNKLKLIASEILAKLRQSNPSKTDSLLKMNSDEINFILGRTESEVLDYFIRKNGSIHERGLKDSDYLAVNELDLEEAVHQPNGLHFLNKAANLKSLTLNRCAIKGLHGIENLKHLEILKLRENRITDLKPLKKLPSITDLQLDSNPIESLKPLHESENLNFVSLSFCQKITSEEVSELESALPNCKVYYP